jgi:hypothetical protein
MGGCSGWVDRSRLASWDVSGYVCVLHTYTMGYIYGLYGLYSVVLMAVQLTAHSSQPQSQLLTWKLGSTEEVPAV